MRRERRAQLGHPLRDRQLGRVAHLGHGGATGGGRGTGHLDAVGEALELVGAGPAQLTGQARLVGQAGLGQGVT